MPLSKTTITGPVYLPDCSKPQDAKIVFELNSWDYQVGEAVFVTGPYIGDLDENSNFSVELFTNDDGEITTSYRASVIYKTISGEFKREYLGFFTLSGPGPFRLCDLNILSEYSTSQFDVLAQAASYATAAENFKNATELAAGILNDWPFYSERNFANATAISLLPEGAVGIMGGYLYEVDTSLIGIASCTSDISVDGLKPFGKVIYPKQYGVPTDGVTDAVPFFEKMVAHLATIGGGTIDCEDDVYVMNSAVLAIDSDDIHFKNFHFKRTSTQGGAILHWAKNTTPVSGGGAKDGKITGLNTGTITNVGIQCGGTVNYANDFVLDNVKVEQCAQNGVAIFNGNNWTCKDVRVLDHGLIDGTITSCIGFALYPRLDSSGGRLINIHTEISAAAQANAGTNCASSKLQMHSNLHVQGFTAKGGTEGTMTLDSVGGILKGFEIYPEGDIAGLSVVNNVPGTDANQNSLFQPFVLEDVVIHGTSKYALSLGGVSSGDDGAPSLKYATIRNVKSRLGRVTGLSRTAYEECTFENWEFDEIYLTTLASGSLIDNTRPPQNNTWINVKATGQGSSIGRFGVDDNNSSFSECGCVKKGTDTVSSSFFFGDDNQITNQQSVGCNTNGITIYGDNNQILHPYFKDLTAKRVFFVSGSNNNYLLNANTNTGTGVTDSGTGNTSV